MRLFTIGHGTRSFEALVAALATHDVRTLVDVRSFPGSRHNPQFSREALERALPAVGIRYVHEPRLGGRRRSKERLPENAAWRNAQFHAYADHMQSAEFEEGLAHLLALAQEAPTAFMCAETVPWRCHRSLLADALLARGHEVVHVLDERDARPHVLTSFARVEGARVTYPRPERPLDKL